MTETDISKLPSCDVRGFQSLGIIRQDAFSKPLSAPHIQPSHQFAPCLVLALDIKHRLGLSVAALVNGNSISDGNNNSGNTALLCATPKISHKVSSTYMDIMLGMYRNVTVTGLHNYV